MFGGLAFFICGNMAISASGQGGVLVHVDPGQSGDLVAATEATTAVTQGREMPGWLRVSPGSARRTSLATTTFPDGWKRDQACAVAAVEAAREQEAEEVSNRYARPSELTPGSAE